MSSWLSRWSISAVLTLAMVASASAGDVEREQKTIPLTTEKSLQTLLDFGAGSIVLAASAPDLILDAQAVYDKNKVEFNVDYRLRRDRGILELSSEMFGKTLKGKPRNEWEIDLARSVPQDLEIDVGAADARLDLSGLQLTDLNLDIGAADAEIWWDEPNLAALKEISIDCGASSLEIRGLGNANFEYMTFDGGLGSFDIDCSGAWTRSAEADFEVGLGSLELTLPENLAVRIVVDGSFVSSVDVDRHYPEVRDNVYESEDYDHAKIRFDIKLKLGMGSADVRVARP
jgi:hypothetical protein